MDRLEGTTLPSQLARRRGWALHMREPFIEEGAKVLLRDLKEEKGQALASELGDSSLFLNQDVTSKKDWSRVIEIVEVHFERAPASTHDDTDPSNAKD